MEQQRANRGPYIGRNKPQEKKSWYERNREHALAKNREWRLKKQIEEQEIKAKVIENEKGLIKPEGLTLFQILDILRKDVHHYLWGKSVIYWNQTDWYKFNQLK
ncbi:hypothetical protein [Flavobacterium sp.]|uniref:hypothetical protein n=1 Tax=Flavobacterium sp. TaxID=239 RepID=UPI00260FADC3|nr:hypothetical protein [Flavobacterium sp.]